MPLHKWVPSRLGHGEQMCAKCFITNREAAALGEPNDCPKPDAPEDAREPDTRGEAKSNPSPGIPPQ